MRLLGRSQTLRCLSSYKLAATRTHSLGIGDNLPPHRGRVAVAMSGGIDSSTAALLLQRQGFDCIGVFMTNWDSSDEVGIGEHCSISKDKNDAHEVCERLGIPLIEVDFVKAEFERLREQHRLFLDSPPSSWPRIDGISKA